MCRVCYWSVPVVTSSLRIAITYAAVSSLAVITNIATQILVIAIYIGADAVLISVVVGTIASIPVKYFFEKKYVFSFKSKNIIHETKLLFLYGLLGIFTTALFWLVEFCFHYFFQTDVMRFVGGVIGLTLALYIKYYLDKYFVFIKELL